MLWWLMPDLEKLICSMCTCTLVTQSLPPLQVYQRNSSFALQLQSWQSGFASSQTATQPASVSLICISGSWRNRAPSSSGSSQEETPTLRRVSYCWSFQVYTIAYSNHHFDLSSHSRTTDQNKDCRVINLHQLSPVLITCMQPVPSICKSLPPLSGPQTIVQIPTGSHALHLPHFFSFLSPPPPKSEICINSWNSLLSEVGSTSCHQPFNPLNWWA